MNVLNYKGYQGRFEYDPEEEIFHGEVMHMADVVTFQGRSVEELKQALEDSIEDYLELCATVGRSPEKPYSGRFNVRISPELHQRIVSRALRDGKSLNAWITEALDHAIQETARL